MSSPQPGFQPPLDYSNNGPGIVISCTILAFIATVCVGLRFWSKRLVRLPWGLDDNLVLAALLMHHAFLASSSVSVGIGGLGRDIRLVAMQNPNNIVVLFKSLFASEITYELSSTLVKLSVLAFYWRIFPTRTVRLSCYILGSICLAWMVAIEVVNVLQCRPLKAFWHLELQPLPGTKCVDTILFFLGNSIANCCIDFATLVLPIHEIAKLHTSKSKKIGVGAVFLLGSIAFAASLLRTISSGIMYREGNTNFTKQFVVLGVATVVEVYTAIIGACLPNMVPAYRKLRYGEALKSIDNSASHHLRAYNPSSNKASTKKASNNRSERNTEGSFERLNEDELATLDYQPGHYGNHNR